MKPKKARKGNQEELFCETKQASRRLKVYMLFISTKVFAIDSVSYKYQERFLAQYQMYTVQQKIFVLQQSTAEAAPVELLAVGSLAS